MPRPSRAPAAPNPLYTQSRSRPVQVLHVEDQRATNTHRGNESIELWQMTTYRGNLQFFVALNLWRQAL
jgi:hypothetical protein